MTALSTIVVRPTHGFRAVRLSELWEYRELLFFLAWRDIKLRYKQTLLGALWAVLQPVLMMAVFTVFFGRLAGMPSDGLPYPLFAYAGLLPWQYFASALTLSGNSLIANKDLITKVYFPRLIVPLAAVMVGLVDLLAASLPFVGMLAFYGVRPTTALAALPALILIAGGTAFGVGLWLSALSVRYRDVRHTFPFITQLWFFLTPVVYPVSLLPASWRPILGVNPMAGVIEGVRWAVLGSPSAPLVIVVVSCLVTLIILATGVVYFRRVERTFADVV